jgi:cell wall-associated NlpC family hydrolase
MEVNRLRTDRLRLGQELLLPGAAVIPMPSTTHTVQEGDNLWNLARRYQTTVEELMALSQLKSNRLHLGQELRLPAPAVASLPPFLARRQSGMTSQENPAGGRNPLAGVPSMDPQDVVLHETSDIAAIRSAILASGSDPAPDQDPSGEAAPKALTLPEQLVIAGFNFLGVRYRWNGTSEKRGFDCSGLVQRLYSLFSIDIPRSSREQFKIGEKIARAALDIGDLVFFSSRGGKVPSHVGIYIGGEQFLHAASRGKMVMVSKLTEEWYSKRFIGARRILDLWKSDSRISENKGN